jgi:hypothetical protein
MTDLIRRTSHRQNCMPRTADLQHGPTKPEPRPVPPVPSPLPHPHPLPTPPQPEPQPPIPTARRTRDVEMLIGTSCQTKCRVPNRRTPGPRSLL